MRGFSRRCVAFVLTIALTALGCVAVGIVTAPQALAAGTPNIALTASASASVLYGAPVTVTLTATNSTTTPGYNVAFTDVLPVGVSYVAGSTLPTSADEPTVLANQPTTGQTTLIWSNATDLPPSDVYALSFSVTPSTTTFLPGSSFDTSAAAYTNTDPRALVQFSAAGVAVPASYTGSATATTHTSITPITVTKSQSYPEGELLRGVHSNKDTYSLVVTNSALNATNSVTVTDYLPAGLEFLGCGGVDNTTNATTNPGSTLEYPGATPLSAGTVLGASCLTPTSVSTVGLAASGGAGSAPAQPVTTGSAVYTQVQWTIGNLAPGASTTLTYLAGVPLKENALFAGGPTAASGQQGSNLDNNSGPETVDGQSLTNLATLSGTYTGALATGATNPVTASGTSTVTAVDLAVQKSVDVAAYSVGGKHVYTLNYETSEYRYSTAVTLTDTLPPGLCPNGTSNYETISNDLLCAPDGRQPSTPYSSVVQLPTAGFTLTWNLGTVAADTSTKITFPTTDRASYKDANGVITPTAAGDTLTDNTSITATTHAVCTNGTVVDKTCATSTTPIYAGEATPHTATNTSSASETTGSPAIVKRVATNTTNPDCTTATYVTAPTIPNYTQGDVVCFQLELDYPAGVTTKNSIITDLFPASASYVAGSATYVTGNTTTPVTPDTSQAGVITWRPADYTSGGATFVNPGAKFLVVFALTPTAGPPVATTPSMTGNLMKVTQTDSAGIAIALRARALYDITAPSLSITHGVQQVNSGPVNGPNVDHVQVNDGDLVTYRIDITNNGLAPAKSTVVKEVLPAQFSSCAMVSAISNGGTCAVVGGVVTLTWPAGGTIAPAGTVTYTFAVTVPANTVAGVDLTSTASITSYQNIPNTTTATPVTYVPGVSGVPAASDPTDVYLGTPTLAKTRTTSVGDTGNDATTQAAIGETIHYTLTETIPAGTTVFNGALTDPLGTGQTYVAGTLAYSVGGVASAAGYTATVASNTVSLAFPTQVSVPATPTTGRIVVVTFDATVNNIAANVRSVSLNNTASFNFKDSLGAAQPQEQSSVATTVVEPSLAVTKTDSAPSHIAMPGATVPYTVTATNTAGTNVSTAYNVVVIDTLPVGMAAPTLVTPAGVVTGSLAAGYVITWTLASLAPGASQALTYSGQVPSTTVAGDGFVNGVVATTQSLPSPTTGIRTSADNITGYKATATDTVTATAPTITKSASPTSVTIGQSTTYTATVTIPANVVVPDATVIDTLPDGMTFDAYVSCVMSDGTTCTALPTPTKNGTTGTTALAWTVGNLSAAAAVRTITIKYTAYPAQKKTVGGAAVVNTNQLKNSIAVYWNTTAVAPPTTIPLPGSFARKSSAAVATVTVVEPTLTITKAASTTSPVPGQTITYTVTIKNTGTSPAYDIAISDPIPAGLTVNAASITGGGSLVSGTIKWAVASLAVGASSVQTYTATFDPAVFHAGTSLSNTASTTWDGVSGGVAGDPSQIRYRGYGPVTSTATVTPVVPVIALAKSTATGKTGHASPGQPFTWTVTLTNSTAAPANSAVITDTLPANWSFNAGTVTYNGVAGADPVIAGQSLTFTVPGTIVSGTPVVLSYQATPSAAALTGPSNPNVNTASSTFKDATGASADADGPYKSNSDTASAIVDSADLALTKTAIGAVVPGAPSQWQITIKNNGPSDAAGPLTVTDTVPAGATALSCSSGWAATNTATTITCTRATGLANRATDTTLIVTMTLPSSTTGSVTNSAVVASPTYDPSLPNNTGSATVTVTPKADLAITKTHTGSFTAGQNGTYTITVSNNGPSDTPGPIQVVDTLPTGMTFVSASAPWTCSGTTTVTCASTAGIVSGASAPVLTLTVAVAATVTATSLTNSATVSGPITDPVPGNNTATDPTTIATSADLSIVKTHNGTFEAGVNNTYTLQVANAGPSAAASAVKVTDTLPTGESFVSGTGTGWTCSAVAQVVTCTLSGSLAAGASAAPITLTVLLASGVTAPITNTATVSSPTPDPVPANNSSTDISNTPITNADVSLLKSANTPTFTAGANGVYTLTVHNAGPADAAGPITVTDPLPAGETFVSGTGTGWACAVAASTVTCTASANLVAGQSLPPITLTVAVASGATLPISNTATAASPTTDPNPNNNSSTALVTLATSADLAITKTHTGTFTAGQNGTYVITVQNNGPSDSPGPIKVVDTLPTGMTLVSASAPWTCTGTTTVTCLSTAAITAGATGPTLTLIVAVASTVTATSLTNSATVSGPITDPVPGNNTATDPTTIATSADLSIVKTHNGTFVAGVNNTYTLQVHNAGPSAAASPVTVTDTLPAPLTFVSGTGTGWSCAAVGQAVTCTLTGPLSAGTDAAPITLTVQLASGTTAPVTNTATVASPTSDPNPSNNSSTDQTGPVTTNADLKIVKSATAPSFVAGTTVGYTLDVSNLGPADASGPITVSDTLPTGETYVSATGTGWSCSAVGQIVTCTSPANLPSTGVLPTIALTVSLASSVTASVSNTATVSSPTPDPDTTNNTATVIVPVLTSADLSISKSHVGSFTAGQNGTYTIGVTNGGPSDSPGPIVVRDTLPAGMSFVSVSAPWSCSGTTTITCTLSGTIRARNSAPPMRLTVFVASSVNAPSLTNTASVSGPVSDPDPSNNSANDLTPIVTSADLSIVKTHNAPLVAGQNNSYTLQVANAGPSDAASPVTVTDTLPAALTYVSATGTNWTCAAAGQTVTCTLAGTLAVGAAAAPITLTVLLASSDTAPVTNTATVSSPTTDPNPVDNSSTDDSGPIVVNADLKISKSADSPTITAGTNGTYQLAVNNLGPADAAGPITVIDTLPVGETFVSGTGTNWTCAAAAQTVTCTSAANLVAGASLPNITLTVAVPSNQPAGPLTNSATVSSSTPDPDMSNNTSTAPVSVITSADVALAKSHTGAFTPGTAGSYSIVVTNHGPSDAANLVLTDPLPAGETFVSAGGSPIGALTWTCTGSAAQIVTCSLSGPMPTGSTATITVDVFVDAGYTGATLVNTVTGSSSTPDPSGPPSSTDTVTVTPLADLAITKTHSDPATAGRDVSYTIGVQNLGPSNAAAPLTVTDTLPAGLTYVSATGNGWSCVGAAASPTVTCTQALGLLVGNFAGPITLVARVGSSVATGTVLNNSATVSSPTQDPAPANNSVVDPTTVGAQADLAIVKTHTGTLVPGQSGTYNLAVTNNGPSDAAGPVTVTDTLPTGLTFVSATGTGWTCAEASGTVTCTLPGLAASATADPITLVVNVGAAAYPSVSNTAEVSSSTSDPDPTNNSSTDTATVPPVSSLTITKTHTGPVLAGGNVVYQVGVTNSGLTEDPGPITVTDAVPTGLTYTSVSGGDWTCASTATLTCQSQTTLAVGATSTFTLTFAVGAAAAPSVTNHVTVTSPDNTNTTTNTADDPTPVTPVANLSLVKSLADSPLISGGTATWLLTITNQGPSPTSGVTTVTDALPAGLTFVSATGAGWGCAAAGQVVTCISTQVLALSAVTVITLVTTVTAAPGDISNTATVTGSALQTASGSTTSTASAPIIAAQLPSTGGSSGLASTGTPVLGLLRWALLFLAGGIALLVLGRRRRRA